MSKLHVKPDGIFAGAMVVTDGAGVTDKEGLAEAGVRVQDCVTNMMSSKAMSPW